ncbi:MAG: alkaline phosphatase family protein [Candidatus Sericytochromatia bacterium]|nr:alkaline phosphatase family protein [Candidatus Sericytochromatia bacterium]
MVLTVRKRLFIAICLPLLVACASTRAWSANPGHRRAIILSCDGGGAVLLQRMMEAGLMPHLTALRRRGLSADYARTSFPSKTAPGHAAIWTGAYGNRNGIVANHVPLMPWADHTLAEFDDGFNANLLQSDPVWVSAAKQGKRTVVIQGTHSTPIEAYMRGGHFDAASRNVRIVDFYKGQLGSHTVYGPSLPRRASDWANAPKLSAAMTLPGEAGTGTMPALLADDPADPTVGYDTVAISPTKDWRTATKLKSDAAGRFSAALPWPDSDGRRTTFRLWDLLPDGTQFRLYRTPVSKQTTNQPDAPSADLGAIAGGPEFAYAKDQFGPTAVAGGDGTAETRYVEALANVLDTRLNVARKLLRHEDWDLTCVYVPFPDAAEHMWVGLLNPDSPHYKPEVARRIETALGQVCGQVDRFIGELAAIAPEAALAMTSDHGLDAVYWDFYPNVLLERAGLLAHTPGGEIDLARSRVFYPVFDGAALVVNRTTHKGGIVAEADVPQLLERAKRALLAAKDPQTGKSVVTAFYPPDPAFGNDGPGGGELYMDLLPGYYFSPQTIAASWWAPRLPFMSGGHIFHPDRPSMHASFAFAGPGIPVRALGTVQTIDVVPTVCDYLGIKPPNGAQGISRLR